MGDLLFVGSCSGWFYAFDNESGDFRWGYDTSGDGQAANFHGDPVVAEGLILVGTDVGRLEDTDDPRGYVYALEQRSGEIRWKYGVTGGVPSDLVRRNGLVYGVTIAGELVCLEIATGKLRWSVDSGIEAAHDNLRYSLLSIDDTIVFSAPEGTIIAVDAASGERRWTRALYDEVNTTMILDGDEIYVGTKSATIFGIDAKTGQLKRQLSTAGLPYGTPVALKDSLLILLDGGTFQRIGKDGEVVWSRTTENEWSSSRPLLLDNRVLVGNSEGELIVFDVSDGTRRDSYRVTGAVRGFSVTDELLYIGTIEGKLFAHRLR